MRKLILNNLIVLIALSFSAGLALANNDLDNPNGVVNARPIDDGTTVLRVDTRNNSAALGHTSSVMNSKADAKKLAMKAKFQALPKDKTRNELDREAGASSWYFYWGTGYYYPTYCNYGYYYNPYYTYSYGYYNYYYYGYPGYYW